MTGETRSRQPTPEHRPPGNGSRGMAAGGAARSGEPPVLDQAFDSDSLYALRAAVAAHSSEAGLPRGRMEDLVIAVHELAANAVRHGAGHGRLRVWNVHGALRCEITDDGVAPGVQPAAATDDGEHKSGDAAPWRIQPGHGLWLARQVADQTSVRTGHSGTVATITFTLGPPGQLTPFHLAQSQEGGCTVLTVSGQLDLGPAQELINAIGSLLAATPALRLILSMGDLAFWGSSGLAAVITAQRRVDASPPARMVLAELPPHLAQRLRDADPAGRFTFAASTAEATTMLSSPA